MVGIIIMGTNIRAWTRVNVAATIAGSNPDGWVVNATSGYRASALVVGALSASVTETRARAPSRVRTPVIQHSVGQLGKFVECW